MRAKYSHTLLAAVVTTVGLTVLAACGSAANGTAATTSAPSSQSAPAESPAGSSAGTESSAGTSAESSDTSAPTSETGANSGISLDSADTVAFLMPDQNSTRYTQFDIPGFQKAMSAMCPKCTVIANDANGDIDLQRSQAEAAIAKGAKAIVVDPVDASSAAGWVNQALARGIDVISYDRGFPKTKVSYYVSFDNVLDGELLAKPLIDKLKDSPEVKESGAGILIVNGSPTDATAQMIKEGIHKTVDPSGISVLAEFDTPDWVPAKAQAWVASQIVKYGTRIKGIVAANDGTGGASVAALKAANLNPRPQVTGNDGTTAGVQLVLEGSFTSTIFKPGTIEAQAAANAVVTLLSGKPATDTPLVDGAKADTVFDTPSQLFTPITITTDNIQKEMVDPGFLTAKDICTSAYQAYCTQYGVN